MKNVLKKMGLVVLMMALTGNVVSLAFAEEETPTPVVTESPAPAEKAEPAPAAEEKSAEPTVVPTEEATVEPTTEATVEPTEEATVEPTEEATVEPTEEATAEPTEEATAEPTAEPTPFAFTGEVKVKLENEGDIYFGDTVTLRAVVNNANADYTIRWEVNKEGSGDHWKTITGETKNTYSFKVDEDNAGYAYRAVLVVAE